MQVQKERIHYLLEAYTSQTASPQEEQELMDWIMDSDDDVEFKNFLQTVWNKAEHGSVGGFEKLDCLFENIVATDRDKVIPMTPVSSGKKISWLRLVAAAVVIFLITGTYFLLAKRQPDKSSPTVERQVKLDDIFAPLENKATIVLSDGKIISLGSFHQGLIANEGGTRLVKQSDVQIAYQKTSGNTSDVVLNNILENPKGSKVIDVVLSDGSRVWLNAASSISYPAEFTGNERKVTINGEAYFEVTHNEQMPFKVVKNGVEVTVLGTHFNVAAYDEGQSVKVSLLQGSVRVSSRQEKILLRPGQQAQVGSAVRIENDIDPDQVVAWKNGFFSFRNTTLVEVMQQISRWYDVDVKYEGQAPQRQFGGKISRNNSLKETLKILEESGVHYTTDNRNIIILP